MKTLDLMNVPDTYQVDNVHKLKKFDNREGQKHHVDTIGNLAKDRKNLILSSDVTGIGKTRLAIGWLYTLWWYDTYSTMIHSIETKEPVTKRWKPKFYKFIDCRYLNHKFDLSGYRIPDMLDKLINGVHAVVVDDIGRESERATQIYMAIMSEFHLRQVPVCYTTNLTNDKFIAKYGEDIKRRILDNGVAISLIQDAK